MQDEDYKRLKRHHKLLKDITIKKIIEELLVDYNMDDSIIDLNTINLTDKNDKTATLNITEDSIIIQKYDFNEIDIKIIKEGPILEEIHYELRPKGLIITNSKKLYNYTIHSKTEKYVTDLYSTRYVLTNDNLYNNYPDIYYKNINGVFYNQFNNLYEAGLHLSPTLKQASSMVTEFQSHMKFYDKLNDIRLVTSTAYSNHTFLNGKDVSHIYDIVKGPDKILKIYDLYNGIINERNMYDIRSINLGLLRDDAFWLKEARKINIQEDLIVSQSVIPPDINYRNKVMSLLNELFSYNKSINWNDRNALLEAIKYHQTPVEEIQRDNEKYLVIHNEENKCNNTFKKVLKRIKSKFNK